MLRMISEATLYATAPAQSTRESIGLRHVTSANSRQMWAASPAHPPLLI